MLLMAVQSMYYIQHGKLERFVVRKDNFVLVIKLAKLKITIGNYGQLRQGMG